MIREGKTYLGFMAFEVAPHKGGIVFDALT